MQLDLFSDTPYYKGVTAGKNFAFREAILRGFFGRTFVVPADLDQANALKHSSVSKAFDWLRGFNTGYAQGV